MSKMEEILDKYFKFFEQNEENLWLEQEIPKEMIDFTKKKDYVGFLFWKPIKSTVNHAEIEDLEKYVNQKLPSSYKSFLQYKHFINLDLGVHPVRFFKNLPKVILNDTIKEIENHYRDLLKRNYIPFAHLSDYGVLCFDANQKQFEEDYPIVSFDHEDDYTNYQVYAQNFESMFDEFDTYLKELIARMNEKII